MALFIVFFGFAQNSGVAQSYWGGGQTDPRVGQAAPAQTTEKNAQDLKALEALDKFLSVARQRAEEYNTLFRDLATEEKRVSFQFNKSGEEVERREVICEFVVYQSRIETNLYDQFFDFRPAIDGAMESFQTGRLISEFGTFQRFTVTSSEQEKKTIIKDKPQPKDKEPEI